MTEAELKALACDIRKILVDVVISNGGHLSSNLGIVELTIALHLVFDTPADKIIFDVGHQSYVHKILTGRLRDINTLRTPGGISGFPKSTESLHDAFDTGHASTSISAALGLARARDMTGGHFDIVAVIGDGALSGGMAYEALNDLGTSGKNVIIVLNDNKMSIDKNVGGMAKYLSRVRLSKRYMKFKMSVDKTVNNIPLIGRSINRGFRIARDKLKKLFVSGVLFEQMGIKYIGPVDGHDFNTLIPILYKCKKLNKPVLLHVVTTKGSGYKAAEDSPDKYHGLSGDSVPEQFSAIVSSELIRLREIDSRVVAVTSAMARGTGLTEFAARYPESFFDTSITEAHAVTMSAGMAKGGLLPYVAIYSTFLQRAFDQILHDVCLQKLPVTFLVDRAGVVGADGPTHQGLYDISYLSLMPGMSVLTPSGDKEFVQMLEFSLSFNKPLAIRYPRDYYKLVLEIPDFCYKRWSIVKKSDNSLYLLCAGNRMLKLAETVAGKIECNIVNCSTVLPVDRELLGRLSGADVVILEENVLAGGLFSLIASDSLSRGFMTIKSFCIDNPETEDRDFIKLLLEGEISIDKIVKYCAQLLTK